MIELAFRKDGVYSLGNGSSVEVVAGEVVQVTERCPSVHEPGLAECLDRNAKAWRKPSERTAVRFVTRAALSKRHAPLLAQGIDPGALTLDDRELLIPTVTREEWDANHAPVIELPPPGDLEPGASVSAGVFEVGSPALTEGPPVETDVAGVGGPGSEEGPGGASAQSVAAKVRRPMGSGK